MLSLFQISHLCDSKFVKFTCKFRACKGEDIQLCKNRFSQIELTNGYFDETVRKLIHDGNLAKIYICGSPQFNASIGKVMVDSQVEEDIYHFM
jgi:ferredoxin-NADP reductase